MEIAVAIPTYNRPDDLRLCVRSVARQSLVPARVLIVDDGDLDGTFVSGLRKELEDAGSRLTYIRKDHSRIVRGTSASRNLIMHAVDEPVLLIDDDIMLDPDCVRSMAETWETADDGRLAGVGGVIRNNRRIGAMERLYNRVFLLDSLLPWDINEAGYQVWDDSVGRREAGHYVHGGFCMYRPAVARKILFPVFQEGRNALEDVHFALSAKILGYRFIVEPKATGLHAHSEKQREGSFAAGFRESVNRREIFRSLCDPGLLNRIRFVWASIGWILRQFLAGRFVKGAGMATGMFIGSTETGL